jgi:hypothetical protein
LSAAVCRRHPSIVELGCDLAQRTPGLALGSDVLDEIRCEDTWPSALRPFGQRSRWLSLLGDQSLELVDGDQLRAPWHLDRLDQR